MSAARVLRAGGLYFDGIDDYAKAAHSPSLSLTELTICFWLCCRRIPLTGWMNIVTKGNEGAIPRNYAVWISSGQQLVLWWYTTDYRSAPSSPITLNVWEHWAVTFRNETNGVKWYRNGVLDRTSTPPEGLTTNTYDLWLGGWSTSGYANMILDDLRIYNRALSADEIKAIYERGALIRNGLVLHLDFSEYEGNVAYDKSGYGNHATIYGARWVVKKQLRTLPETG